MWITVSFFLAVAIKYIRSTGHPVLNASGDIIEYFGAARDMDRASTKREAALETAFEQIKAFKGPALQ